MSGRARAWARRRQGTDPPQLTLASQRIYILPTAAGLVYALMLATMLAGSMNYNNNLGFALTFLLAAVAIVAIYHTHRNLCGLRLRYIGADPVFAGDTLAVRFALANDAVAPRDEIILQWPDAPAVAGGVPALDSRIVSLPLATRRRGPLPLPPLRLATRAPLGLMQAWAWVHMDARPIVYPRPAADAMLLPSRTSAASVDGARQPGDDDLAGLRAYQPGDSPRRIAWKSYARTGMLLSRDFRSSDSPEPIWLDWDAVPGPDAETRIAQLARLVLDACAGDRSWGLRLPGTSVAPGTGQEQLHRCLQALATTALPAGNEA